MKSGVAIPYYVHVIIDTHLPLQAMAYKGTLIYIYMHIL